jgi:hypothetical protein
MKAVNVLDQRVGERLRSWRLKMGLSQSGLSAAGRNAAPLTGQGQGKAASQHSSSRAASIR